MSASLLRRSVLAVAAAGLVVPVIALAVTPKAAPHRAAAPAVRTSPPTAVVPSTARAVASGSAQRTFVSANHGNDANPCTATQPCRNFAAAIAQAAPGGEVVALDSGGYGPVTIGNSISLISPPGVYAGITAFSGNAITINAGASDVVTIRGLTLNGLGGAAGVVFNSGGALYVQQATIKNFASYGIFIYPSGSALARIEDTTVIR